MENAVRTRKFLAVIEGRKTALRQSLEQIIPPSRELVCEFGCGHGHFLVAYSLAHPATLCLGVDIESDRVERARRKQKRAKLLNLHFLQADARLFLEVLPPTVRFGGIFILFPDPWPKKRHHKHRLIQARFLSDIRRHATDNTRIFFRTDYDPYFEEARAAFVRHAEWELTDECWPFEHESVFQSRAVSYRSFIARPRRISP